MPWETYSKDKLPTSSKFLILQQYALLTENKNQKPALCECKTQHKTFLLKMKLVIADIFYIKSCNRKRATYLGNLESGIYGSLAGGVLKYSI